MEMTKALGWRNLHGKVFKMGKRGDAELEHRCINVRLVNGDWSILIGALKVDDTRRNRGDREVVESLIKTSMSGDFDTGGFGVMPKDVSSGTRHTPKENATPGIGFEFCYPFPWRSGPHTTPKGLKEVGEILNDIGGFCDW